MNKFAIVSSLFLGTCPLFAQGGSTLCGEGLFQSRVETDQYIIGVAGDGDLMATLSAVAFRLNLHVWDFSNPQVPVPSSTTELVLGYLGNANDVALSISGAGLAVGRKSAGEVNLFEIDASLNPIPGGTLVMGVDELQIDGDLLYVLGSDLFSVFNISDMQNPVLLGDLPGAYASGFEVVDGLLYIGSGIGAAGELEIYDVTNPAAMTLQGSLSVGSSVWSVGVQGNVAYIPFGGTELASVDVSDATVPVFLGSVESDGNVRQIALIGDRAYLAGSDSVSVVNISNPATLDYHGAIGGPAMLNAPQMMVNNGQLWVGSNHDLSHFDGAASVPFDSDLFVGVPAWAAVGAKLGFVSTHGGYVYAIDTANNLFVVIDDSNVSQPVVVASIAFGFGLVADIAFSGDNAFVLHGSSTVFVIDISDPSAPVVTGSWDGGGSMGIEAEGSVLYVSPHTGDLKIPHSGTVKIHDISDPLVPVLLSEYFVTSGDNISEFKVQDGIMMLYRSYFHGGGEQGTTLVVDVTNPSLPSAMGIGFNFDVRGVERVGDHLVFVRETGGFGGSLYGEIASAPLAGPHWPEQSLLRFTSGEDNINGGVLSQMIRSGNLLIVPSRSGSGGISSLALFDVSDPASLKYAGAVQIGAGLHRCVSAASNGQRLYIVSGNTGVLGIFDMAGCEPSCLADMNGDGELNFFDISAFLTAFTANEPAADFTNDGIWDFFDVSAFLQDFATGCP